MDKTERWWIWGLSAAAGVRVFVYAAAFPFFNNVDERAHVDLVFKYANAEIPHGLPTFSPGAVRYLWLYASPEYFMDAKSSEEEDFAKPFWTLSREQIAEIAPAIESQLLERINHEASDPPLYYAITGVWLRVGSWCGLTGGYLLYWIRFLNIPVAVTMVWIAYIAARLIFPENSSLRFAVPILTAFFPQDNLYSVQSDAWSALWFGLAFVGILKLQTNQQLDIRWAALTGLALSAACLTKVVNLPLLAVVGAVVLTQMWRLFRAGKIATAWPAALTLGACTILPVLGWMMWNCHAFGDVSGTAAKIEYLGWTRKSISDWWSHPIFSLRGVHEFWSGLMASFWRGEFIWHGVRLASTAADAFYWISSTAAIAIVAGILFSRAEMSILQRRALWLAFASFFVLVIFLALLSVGFDFGKSVYPSPEHPYFISGRLLTGALIPFCVLYASALDCIATWVKRKWLTLLLCGSTVMFSTASEVAVNSHVFRSPYNFFHMSSERTSPRVTLINALDFVPRYR